MNRLIKVVCAMLAVTLSAALVVLSIALIAYGVKMACVLVTGNDELGFVAGTFFATLAFLASFYCLFFNPQGDNR